MSVQNQYARLKTRVIKFDKSAPPVNVAVDINIRHLIVNLLCPEIPADIEREFNKANLKPYELAVRSMGNSDYLYDTTEIENGQTRYIKLLDLVAAHTVASSDTCIVIVSFLEFVES
jgi:hypothetical protein